MRLAREDRLFAAVLVTLVTIAVGIAWFAVKAHNDAEAEVTTWCDYRGGEVVEVCLSNCMGKYPSHEFWCVSRIREQAQ